METDRFELVAAPLLGHYLDCSDDVIEAALACQRSGIYGHSKRLGDVLLERRDISPEALRQGLIAQRVERLRRCALFVDFDRQALTGIFRR